MCFFVFLCVFWGFLKQSKAQKKRSKTEFLDRFFAIQNRVFGLFFFVIWIVKSEFWMVEFIFG